MNEAQTQEKELTLEELHIHSLRIMKEIDAFCMRNGIRYSLAFGSLLGAIRHRGFIPWDDDMDIAMPRPDYEKFVRSFKSDSLVCVAPETGSSHLTFARVADAEKTWCKPFLPWSSKRNDLGVWIDVFPMDGEPDDPEAFSRYIEKLNHLNDENRIARERLLKLHPSYHFSILKNLRIIVKRIIYAFGTPGFYWRKMIRLIRTNPYGNTAYAGLMVLPVYGTKNRTRTDVFESYIRAPFEDCEFSIFTNYDEFLRDIYGDYMQLPPEDERIPRHRLHRFYERNTASRL